MSLYLAIRDGGKTNEEGALRFLEKIMKQTGVTGVDELKVTEKGAGANMSVDVSAGDLFLAYSNYMYHVWSTATENLVISSNSSGNTRIDAVVAWVDRSVVSSASSNNPNAFKLTVVDGTPSGSPAAPSDGDIETAIGAGNPYLRIANVTVVNGETAIDNSEISDQRVIAGVKVPVEDWIDDVDGTTITFNIESGKKHRVTLGGNRTLALSNTVEGDAFILALTQDGSGNRTVTWFSGISWENNGAVPVLTTTGNKTDLFGFIRTGSGTYYGFVIARSI